MCLSWLTIICLLPVHPISTRSADEALEALSEDLFHFLSLSVQINVQEKMKQGPVDLQSLADRISDLGVSFRQLDEQNIAELEDQLTAIGTDIESECSSGCALPSEVTAGLGVIDILKKKKADVDAAFKVASNIALGGNVAYLASCLKNLHTFLKGPDFSDLELRLKDAAEAAAKVDLTKPIPAEFNTAINNVRDKITAVNSMLEELGYCKTVADELNENEMTTQTDRLQKCNALPQMSKDLIAESPKMIAFQQNSDVFAAKLAKLKMLFEQNQSDLVLAELKTLERLNVGSKFLDYFDNSFTASKWLTKLLAGKEGQSLEKLKEQLIDVKNIGERLGPLRTFVQDVNSWDAHHALLNIEILLEKSVQLLPDLAKSASELSACTKTVNLAGQISINLQPAIDNLKNPQDHVSEFSQSVGALKTDQAQSIAKLDNFLKVREEGYVKATEFLKNAAEVTALQSSADALKTAFENIKTEKMRKWIDSTAIDKILADSRTWIENSAVLTSLKCLADANSTESVNASVAVLPEVVKLGKSDGNTAAAIKVANDLKTAIDLWKQLATPPARRRRRRAANTPIDEMIESTMALRRLLRACSRDVLGVLARSAPQLDPTIKTTFENIGKACDELQATSEKVTKVTELAGMFAVLKPLADTNIDTVKLADQLASPSNPPDVQQALQDLKEIDLQFATYDSDQVDKALDGLELLLGLSHQKTTSGWIECVGDDCEEPFNWIALVILMALFVGVAIAGAITGKCAYKS